MLVVSRFLSALSGVSTKSVRQVSTNPVKFDRGPLAKDWSIIVKMLKSDAVYLGVILVALTSIGGYTLYSVSPAGLCL